MSIKLTIYLQHWYFRQNQCLNIKNMMYTTNIDQHGPLCSCPVSPCIKTTLYMGAYSDPLFVDFIQWLPTKKTKLRQLGVQQICDNLFLSETSIYYGISKNLLKIFCNHATFFRISNRRSDCYSAFYPLNNKDISIPLFKKHDISG